jgi:hypothetical protein
LKELARGGSFNGWKEWHLVSDGREVELRQVRDKFLEVEESDFEAEEEALEDE